MAPQNTLFLYLIISLSVYAKCLFLIVCFLFMFVIHLWRNGWWFKHGCNQQMVQVCNFPNSDQTCEWSVGHHVRFRQKYNILESWHDLVLSQQHLHIFSDKAPSCPGTDIIHIKTLLKLSLAANEKTILPMQGLGHHKLFFSMFHETQKNHCLLQFHNTAQCWTYVSQRNN